MILKLYSIYDSAADRHQPFFAINDALAIRTFEQVCKDPNTDVARHPQDFTLWRNGEYDQKTGLPTPDTTATQFARAFDFFPALEAAPEAVNDG